MGPSIDTVRAELADDPTVDITTTGRASGQPRRIEIWMLDVDGRCFITGTPGRRDWLANLDADPNLVVHLKRHAHVDLPARAIRVDDEPIRRAVLEHHTAEWYRSQEPLDVLVETAPMVEITFESDVLTVVPPTVITAYQAAHDRRDVVTALAQFADDAVVVDDGHTYRGTDEIETFIRSAASEYTYTRTVLDADEVAPGQWLVTCHLEGDFPGGTVDLDYRFHLDGDRITHLTIAP